MALKLNSASGSITISPEDGSGNVDITFPRAGYAGTASPTFTGTINGANLTLTGDLTVNGTTTTISSTNTEVADALLELANGTTGSPSNDAGLVIERGDSDNAFMGWDESADKFVFGTGSFTGASTGDLTVTTGTVVANVEGDLTGEVNAAVFDTTSSKVSITGTTSVHEIIEKCDVQSSTSGTINFNFLTKAVEFYNVNQTANRTINFRGDASNTLNSIMAVGESMTCSVAMQQGGTAYYLSSYQIDGTAVTPKWSGGSAPSAGNASSTDVYTFTIIKTAASTYTVLASQTQYA